MTWATGFALYFFVGAVVWARATIQLWELEHAPLSRQGLGVAQRVVTSALFGLAYAAMAALWLPLLVVLRLAEHWERRQVPPA